MNEARRAPRSKSKAVTPAAARTRATQPRVGAPPVLLAAVLVVFTVLAYVPALGGGFVWDDDAYVTQNRTLRSLDGLRRMWTEPGAVPQYYPLVHTSFWVEYHLWGTQPFGYHAINLLLHVLNALLLGLVLQRLRFPGAWVAAAIFVVHPVHVESVAWITERKNVLSAACYLTALLAYLRFSGLEPGATSPSHPRRLYAMAVVFFVGALLSKTVTCSLPAVLLLIVWWKKGRIARRDVIPLLPLFAVGLALSGVTVWMETHHVGATGSDWALSVTDRCLIAGRALWFYAMKLAWPQPLIFIYPRWRIDAGVWWQYAFPGAALALMGLLWAMRRRLGRGPLVGVLVFAGTLMPALGFVDVFPMRYSFVADHYQYLASASLIAMATAFGATQLSSSATRSVVAGGVLVVLGVLTWRQGHAYQNLETLWADTLAKNPDAWMAHNNLGLLLFERGKHADAIAHYQAALRIKPDDSYAYNNLGNTLAADGRMAEAIEDFEAALRIEPGNAEARNNLGNAMAAQGRMEEAATQFAAAVRLRPSYAEAHNNLGNTLAAQGRVEEAVAHYTEALRLDPAYVDAHHNLGVLLADQGKFDDAVRELSTALQLRPNDAKAQQQLDQVRTRLGQRD